MSQWTHRLLFADRRFAFVFENTFEIGALQECHTVCLLLCRHRSSQMVQQ